MTRRIAYVSLIVGPTSGVERKILGQARALQRIGADEVDVIIVGEPPPGERDGVRYVHVRRSGLLGPLRYGLRRFALVEGALDLGRYDLVLFRYPFADPAAATFAERYPVVSEHHTKEIPERLATLKETRRPDQLVHQRLSLTYERQYGPLYLSQVHGIVGVTDEIRRYELERAGRSLPSLTLPNGIDVEAVPHTRFTPFDGRTLHLVFVGAGSASWHGVDRLLAGLATYRGGVAIHCHLVGGQPIAVARWRMPAQVRVELHGPLYGGDLDRLLASATMAIGPLAVHRKGLSEACPLKTREYAARGIPFLYSHEDPDLRGPDADSFTLKVPADESPIPMAPLLHHAEQVSRLERDKSLSDAIRAYASSCVDWSLKMTKALEFLRGVRI
jgi:glycosyltransferase involved in cell wall biosynthesis